MLKESANSLPPEFATHRVLPTLVSALERGGASTSAASIVPLLLQLGKNVPTDEEYVSVVIGPVVSLFASPDRGVRMALLDNLDEFKDKMDKKIVVDKVWPHLVGTAFLPYPSSDSGFHSKRGSRILSWYLEKQQFAQSASYRTR